MIRIGIVGEDPNDTDSIINLLSPTLRGRAQIIRLLRRKRGGQLDNAKTENELRIEVDTQKPALLIVVRDSDCIRTEDQKLKGRSLWYQNLTKSLAIPKLLLLNIAELEALILADIDSFNKLYKVLIKPPGDVSMIADPKKLLREKTDGLRKKFQESDCPTIFSNLDIAVIQKNCLFFRDFMVDFKQELFRIDGQA